MKNGIQLSLVLPCYNESTLFSESLLTITSTLARSRLFYELIFVDDNSTDNTVQLITAYCRKYNNARAIYHKKNIGRGRTVADGIAVARAPVVGYIDIDCEVHPVYISEMVALILEKKADIVIGKRIYRTSLSSIVREVLSIGYMELANKLLHTDRMDTESGYKFFSRKKILPILKKTKHPHWFWDTEIMVLSKLAGLRIVELPVLFLRRTDKVSSVRIIPDTIDYLRNIWVLHKRLYK